MFEQLSFEQLLVFPASVSDAQTLTSRFGCESSHPKADCVNKGIERVSDRSVSDGQRTTHGREDASCPVSSNVSLTACINKYSPAKRKTEYFRLSYRIGLKTKHIHIRGGNINNPVATSRAKQLQLMIDRNADLSELLNEISSFKGCKP